MTITFSAVEPSVDTNGVAADGTNVVTKPAGATTDDVYIIWSVATTVATGPADNATATGFTEYDSLAVTQWAAGNDWYKITWLARIHDGSEGASFTVTQPNTANTYWTVGCFFMSGVDISGGIGGILDVAAADTVSTTAAGSASAPSVTTATDGAAAVIYAATLAQAISAGPAGFSTVAALDGGFSNIYSKTQTPAGATGTPTITYAASTQSALTTHAYKPAAVPATTPTAPLALTGVAGSGEVALDWNAPASDGGATITDYVVQYRTAGVIS